MECPACHTQLSANARFCPHCGHHVEQPAVGRQTVILPSDKAPQSGRADAKGKATISLSRDELGGEASQKKEADARATVILPQEQVAGPPSGEAQAKATVRLPRQEPGDASEDPAGSATQRQASGTPRSTTPMPMPTPPSYQPPPGSHQPFAAAPGPQQPYPRQGAAGQPAARVLSPGLAAGLVGALLVIINPFLVWNSSGMVYQRGIETGVGKLALTLGLVIAGFYLLHYLAGKVWGSLVAALVAAVGLILSLLLVIGLAASDNRIHAGVYLFVLGSLLAVFGAILVIVLPPRRLG